jgi:hypothetical protein
MVHSKAMKVTLFLCILALFLVGVLFNANYGHGVGSGSLNILGFDAGAWSMVATSSVSDIVKVASWMIAGALLFTRKHWPVGLMALVVAIITSAWSLFSSAGFLGGAQASHVDSAAKTTPAYQIAKSEYDAAMKIINAETERTPQKINADITKIKARPAPRSKKSVGEMLECDAIGTSAYGDVSREYCPQINSLTEELKSIKAAKTARIAMAAAKVKMDAAKEKADSQTGTISAMLSLVGVSASNDKIRAVVTLDRVALLEVVQPLLSLIFGALYGSQSASASSQSIAPVKRTGQSRSQMDVSTPVDGHIDRPTKRVSITAPDRRKKGLPEKLILCLENQSVDDAVSTTLGRLSDDAGASKNTIKTALNALQRDRLIDWSSSQKGLFIKILKPAY